MKYNPLKALGAAFRHTSAKAASASFFSLMLLGGALTLYGAENNNTDFISCGGAVLVLGLIVFICITAIEIGGPKLASYDRDVLGKGFPDPIRRHYFAGTLELLKEGRYDEGLEALQELGESRTTDHEKGVLAFYTAICYLRMGYNTNSANSAVTALEHGVKNTESLLVAARGYSAAGNCTDSIKYYQQLEKIVEEKKTLPFVFNELGEEYLTAGDHEGARCSFMKSLSYGIQPPRAQAGMALVCLQAGQEEEACHWYRLALISGVEDFDSFRARCRQICRANGYDEDFLDKRLRSRSE